MQTIKIDISKIANEQIDLIVDYLKRGQVIAYPTDTIYGLGCDAGNVRAIEKINKIKGERANKPFLVLISDFVMLEKYCVVNSEQMEYLEKVWGEQQPTTVILENRKNLPDELTRPLAGQAGGLDSLAVRLPKSEFLIKMISTAGFPIVSTSLNKTGQSPLTNAQNLEKYFEYLPDLVIDAGESENTKPSKLVDLRDVKNIKILRK